MPYLDLSLDGGYPKKILGGWFSKVTSSIFGNVFASSKTPTLSIHMTSELLVDINESASFTSVLPRTKTSSKPSRNAYNFAKPPRSKNFCGYAWRCIQQVQGFYISTDVRGMLSLYESAQLRIKGESILHEAFAFTKTKLKSLEKTLEGTLATQVKHALESTVHRGHPMVEARKFLSHFDEEISGYDSLLTLAKLHFNYLQLLQKGELQTVSKWWKDLELQVKTSYVRDRVPVWALTLFLEPYYSQARIITTKVLLLLVVLDDTYDAYATIEELRVLTHAINRWDITAMSQLPEYIKPFYKFILNEYAEWNKQIPQQGTTNLIEASKKAFQEMATAYLQEAEWRHSGEVPSFEEYMKIGLITSGSDIIFKSALSSMGKIVTQEAIAWYESQPKILIAGKFIARLQDDVVTFTFERARAPSVTGVDAYMKTFGVLEDVAMEAIKNVVENRWKDINEGCLKPREVPMGILVPLVNLSRIVDVFYKYKDGFTFPENMIKEYITLLFCISIPM